MRVIINDGQGWGGHYGPRPSNSASYLGNAANLAREPPEIASLNRSKNAFKLVPACRRACGRGTLTQRCHRTRAWHKARTRHEQGTNMALSHQRNHERSTLKSPKWHKNRKPLHQHHPHTQIKDRSTQAWHPQTREDPPALPPHPPLTPYPTSVRSPLLFSPRHKHAEDFSGQVW